MAGGNYDRTLKNSQLNPAVSYAFALQVEASFFLPLRSVRVFNKENEFDYYQEGGLNDYVHMLRKPISKPFTFQVERYVGVDAGFFDMNSGFVDPLSLGTDLALPLILYVNRSPSANWYKNISFLNCARAYVFSGCTVISKEYGELNAEQSRLLTETTTISYRELFVLNQISPAWERLDEWKMMEGNYLGVGVPHDSNRSTNYSKSIMENWAEEHRWKWDKDLYPEGNGNYHTDERSRKNDKKSDNEQKGKENQWIIDKDHPKGNDKFHTDERSRKNDKKSDNEQKGKENQWIIDKDHPNGNDKFHTDERSRKNDKKSDNEQKGKENQWIIDKDHPNGGGKDHEQNRNKNESKSDMTQKGMSNKWGYPGSKDAATSKDHPQNRNINEKPVPVKWPPTRRALRAQALSEL